MSQIVFAAGLILLFLRQNFATAPAPFYTWLGWLDPLTGLAGVWRGVWPWLAVLSMAALTVAALWGRLFCGWLCPVGLVLDLLAAGKRLVHWRDWRPGPQATRFLNGLRWLVLGGVAGLILLGHTMVLVLDPLVLWAREVHRLLLHLIPWSLGALIVLGLIGFPRFWCRFLCPTGSALGLAARLRGRSRTAGEACTGCRVCVRRCPMANIDQERRFGGDCLGCGECGRRCPARSLARPKPAVPVDEGRRDLLLTTGVGLGVLTLGGITRAVPLATAAGEPLWPRFLRPPGALAEEDLKNTCDRCGQCLRVCPTKCLVPVGLETGLTGFWTPRFVPRRGRCMFCNACDLVCPTGALAPVAPDALRMGTAEIHRDKCLVWTKGLRCFVCREVCPKLAINVDASDRPLVDEEKCAGCGACEANCPVDGAAILVVRRGEIRRHR